MDGVSCFIIYEGQDILYLQHAKLKKRPSLVYSPNSGSYEYAKKRPLGVLDYSKHSSMFPTNEYTC